MSELRQSPTGAPLGHTLDDVFDSAGGPGKEGDQEEACRWCVPSRVQGTAYRLVDRTRSIREQA